MRNANLMELLKICMDIERKIDRLQFIVLDSNEENPLRTEVALIALIDYLKLVQGMIKKGD